MSSVLRASATSLMAALLLLSACEEKPREVKTLPALPKLHPAISDTIGQYAIFADGQPLHVEGYGLVAALPGTGSGDMPPKVRDILRERLIKDGAASFMYGTENISPEKILSSNVVAAVEVHGEIPPLARRGESFDLKVTCLPSSQATNVSNGILWTAELKVIGLTADTGNDTFRVALGRGPVLVSSPIELAMGKSASTQPGNSRRALRTGRVLGGGRVAEDRPIRLQMFQPNIRLTGVIERAINSRFPGREKCASADNENIVSLKIPPEYHDRPMEFINLVQHMFLSQESPGFTERKAAELIRALNDPKAPRKDLSLALQALGRSVLPEFIQPQYTNPDPVVRFWCARAGAGLQDVGGMVVLQEFAKDDNSPLKKDAVASLVELARGSDSVRATITLGELLKSKDIAERVAAYEGLVAIRSPAVQYFSVGGGKFLLDIVESDSPSMIYITQRGFPRIALIGRPLKLPPGTAYVSPDNALTMSVEDDAETGEAAVNHTGMITASALAPVTTQPAKKDTVSYYYRSPFGDRSVNLKGSPRVQDVVARLGWAPQPKAPGYDAKAPYIGASYQRIAEMLASLCKEQIIDAQFVLQDPPVDTYRTTADIVGGARPEATVTEPTPAPITPALTPLPEPAPTDIPTGAEPAPNNLNVAPSAK